MKKFGIFTTGSEVWFHLHPLVPALYYYRVSDCREFIKTNSIATMYGRSKDGSVTASGFLISKDAPFIKRRALSLERVGTAASWRELTDRQTGLRGAEITVALLRLRIFPELGVSVRVSEEYADQLAGRDIFIGEMPCEIKTERVISANLFVQDEEGGHRPTLLHDGTERVTEMPPFTASATDAERHGYVNGFVGYGREGHLVHYCPCGAEAGFGFNVRLLKDQFGDWYCAEHVPQKEQQR
jgi:hypothetical protein